MYYHTILLVLSIKLCYTICIIKQQKKEKKGGRIFETG